MDQTAPADQIVHRHISQCGKEPDMGCPVHIPSCGDRKKETRRRLFALHFFTDSGGQLVREKANFFTGFGGSQAKSRPHRLQPT